MSTGSASTEAPRGLQDRGTRAVVAFLLFATVGLLLWFLVPRFADMYGQVNVTLPEPTLRVLSLMHLACTYPLIWIAITVTLPWMCYRKKGRLADFGLIAMGSLGMALILWIGFSLFMPLIGTLEHISRRG